MKRFSCIFLIILALSACSTEPSDSSVNTAIANTEAAKPSDTQIPIPTDTYTLVPTDTATPTVTPTSTHTPTKTPTATITPIPTDSILYFEDFEDGKADKWDHFLGRWSVANEAGNNYWVGKGPSMLPNAKLRLGQSTWTDYAFESRIRIITGTVNLTLRRDDTRTPNYTAHINPDENLVYLWVFDGMHLKTISSGSPSLKANQWYMVRFEVKGHDLKLFIDDELVTSGTDTLIDIGGVGYYMGGSDEVHFDDVKVWSLID